ncbi:glycosyltransferase family 2 protein [Bifidobacterium canis]|uniref:Glycosyl transferase family 2 n=1 Tax=Bifidobacterium canis TaxID=2610880 RepID=A0A7K1J5E0_9BIFI|nr:glycosyltransferase family 2 protein [Bifidobacterium canis]MUH59878.1 glycosyl transferase family 2 [Bifidobacterium canis]
MQSSSAIPTFSVVIPVHNVETYLPRLFTTLRNQNLEQTEIIFVDDGSTDRSPQLLDEVANEEHFVVLHQNNQGVATARNNAVAHANGDYLCFIDPDDNVSDGYFATLRETAARTHADLLLTDWWKMKDDGIERKEISMLSDADNLDAHAVLNTILHTDTIIGSLWAKAFARHLFTNNPFPPQRTCSDFVPCVTAIANARTVAYASGIHYEYTSSRPDSLQNSQSEQDVRDSVLVHQQFSHLLQEKFPDLMPSAELDMLGSRMQACIHTCRSAKISPKRRKHVFYEYQRGLFSHIPQVWHEHMGSRKDRVLYTIISLGYVPAQAALKTRAHIARARH